MAQTFQPTTDTDLSDIVQDAIANGTRLEVFGGGTKRAIGRATQTDASVTVQSIAGITDYDPTELVVTARAGTPVRELTAAMAAESQHFALSRAIFVAFLASRTTRPSEGSLPPICPAPAGSLRAASEIMCLGFKPFLAGGVVQVRRAGG